MQDETPGAAASSRETSAATQVGRAGNDQELSLTWKKIGILGRPVGAALTALERSR